jgi:pantoate--beta-alanine ligase
MDVIAGRNAFRAAMNLTRSRGAAIGFVPTMGALHAGHLSLLRRARVETDHLALSIFVNPLQFGMPEDLAAYPRPLQRDLELAADVGCDTVFAPSSAEVYPGGRPTVAIDPGPMGERLEGASRPGHFRGVLTVVAKLFNLTGRCRAYFGEKDAQQFALIRAMVDQLDVPVEVIRCTTVREPDGLALSSRNVRLTPEERSAAVALSEALQESVLLAAAGEDSRSVLAAAMRERIEAEPLAQLDYATVVNDETWEEPSLVEVPARAVVAARFGLTRLIDNASLSIGSVQETSPNGQGSPDGEPGAR